MDTWEWTVGEQQRLAFRYFSQKKTQTVSVAPFEEDFIKDTWNCCDRGFKRSDQDETIDVILH